jgi:hypothetical protein
MERERDFFRDKELTIYFEFFVLYDFVVSS